MLVDGFSFLLSRKTESSCIFSNIYFTNFEYQVAWFVCSRNSKRNYLAYRGHTCPNYMFVSNPLIWWFDDLMENVWIIWYNEWNLIYIHPTSPFRLHQIFHNLLPTPRALIIIISQYESSQIEVYRLPLSNIIMTSFITKCCKLHICLHWIIAIRSLVADNRDLFIVKLSIHRPSLVTIKCIRMCRFQIMKKKNATKFCQLIITNAATTFQLQ